MSENKGKDGELLTAITLSNMGLCKDGVDFTRQTITNTADQGADFILTHPKGFLKEIASISGSELSSQSAEKSKKNKSSEHSRIDVKTTQNKLQKDTVEKFIADCNNHPTCKGHILLGGKGLTKPAKKEFTEAQDRYAKDGKTLLHISNDGVKKLNEHYKPPIEDKEEKKK